MTHFNFKATPTKDIDQSCHLKVVELVYNRLYGIHITPLVINSLGVGTHTHTHTYTHIYTHTHAHTQAYIPTLQTKTI